MSYSKQNFLQDKKGAIRNVVEAQRNVIGLQICFYSAQSVLLTPILLC